MEWQPIESAPKDGDEILVCKLYDDGSCCFGIYWWCDEYWAGEDIVMEPTHWMPLPAPPNGTNA